MDKSGKMQCRATGAFAMLTPNDYTKRGTCPKCETGSYLPPGMDEVAAQDGGRADIGHLIPYAAAGSGRDPRNLVPLFRETNQYDMNWGPEQIVRKALREKKNVSVSVRPFYNDPSSGVPSHLDYAFTVFGSDGTSKTTTCVILNQADRGGTTCT